MTLGVFGRSMHQLMSEVVAARDGYLGPSIIKKRSGSFEINGASVAVRASLSKSFAEIRSDFGKVTFGQSLGDPALQKKGPHRALY
jgi:hypothetical protein